MLITEAYRQQQEQLHENPHYGMASLNYANDVAMLMQQVGAMEILDYGAGKGRLGEALKAANFPGEVHHYDPARPEWSKPPQPCSFVACIDVLEHIEPNCLDEVLDDLARVTTHHGFFTVHTGAAMKRLPDGRNAHLIQEPLGWWFPKFDARFNIMQIINESNGFTVTVK